MFGKWLCALLLSTFAGLSFASAPVEKIEATVYWRVSLDADGNVQDLKPTLIHANSTLRTAVEPVIRKWKFSPGSVNGNPAATETTLVVSLSLIPTADGHDYSLHFSDVRTGGSVGTRNAPPHMTRTQVDLLKRSGKPAYVVLDVTFDGNGKAVSVVPAEGSPVSAGTFFNSASRTLRDWTYFPERVAGHGIPGRLIVPFCFDPRPSGVKEPGCHWDSPEGKSPIEPGQGLAMDSAVRLLTDVIDKAP